MQKILWHEIFIAKKYQVSTVGSSCRGNSNSIRSFDHHVMLKCALQVFAFDEGERFLIQSKSTFLEFLRGIYRYKFGLPKKFFRGKIIQGE